MPKIKPVFLQKENVLQEKSKLHMLTLWLQIARHNVAMNKKELLILPIISLISSLVFNNSWLQNK